MEGLYLHNPVSSPYEHFEITYNGLKGGFYSLVVGETYRHLPQEKEYALGPTKMGYREGPPLLSSGLYEEVTRL